MTVAEDGSPPGEGVLERGGGKMKVRQAIDGAMGSGGGAARLCLLALAAGWWGAGCMMTARQGPAVAPVPVEPVQVATNPPPAVVVPVVTIEPPPVAHPIPGEDWKSPVTGMEFMWVGALKMWVGKYEVTNGEYRKMKSDHYSGVYQGQSLNGDRQPVVQVNFYRARELAEWMTQKDFASGSLSSTPQYRLPSEDEWLVFARCGEERAFPWGKEMPPKYGNYSDASVKASFAQWTPIPGYNDGCAVSCVVEQSGKNEWGLYGVGGNVWEPVARDDSGKFFATWHGASWRYDNSKFLRCDYCSARDATSLESDFGFRLVMVCEGEVGR
jgi:formylglycine-generating enzyme required for sulfatase activity